MATAKSSSAPKQKTDHRRFWEKVSQGPNGCWEWCWSINKAGYGRFYHQGQCIGAHRFAYLDFYKDIPDRLVLDHLCRNRRCVNPFHLEPVTAVVNTMRGYGAGVLNKAKTHCPVGHPYDEHTYPVRGGARGCAPCMAVSRKKYEKSEKGKETLKRIRKEYFADSVNLNRMRDHRRKSYYRNKNNECYISPEAKEAMRKYKREWAQKKRLENRNAATPA